MLVARPFIATNLYCTLFFGHVNAQSFASEFRKILARLANKKGATEIIRKPLASSGPFVAQLETLTGRLVFFFFRGVFGLGFLMTDRGSGPER